MTDNTQSQIDKPTSTVDAPGVEQSATDPKSGKDDPGQSQNHLRKPALSKREIMEELSRARFPWDD